MLSTRGVEIFSDRTAMKIKKRYREMINHGTSAEEAVDRLKYEFSVVPDRPEIFTLFWVAIAASQWQTGSLTDEVKHNALTIIDNESDLVHWNHDPDLKAERKQVLKELRNQISPEKKSPYDVRKSAQQSTPFLPGDALAYLMPNKSYMILRVIRIYRNESGCAPVCDICNWCGYDLPPNDEIINMPHVSIPGTAIINGERIKGHSLLCIATHSLMSFPKYRLGIIYRGLDFNKHNDILYYTNWQNLEDCLLSLKMKPGQSSSAWWKIF